MKNKTILTILLFLFSVNIISAQFIVKNVIFAANGISNEGKISGYQTQAGPYSLWLPDSGNVIIDIGGVAPGNGVGGQARISTDGNLISGTSIGINGPEMSIYNRTTDQWTTKGSLGFSVDGNVSGGFSISGDGNTVAGLSWADTTGGYAYAHAVAANPIEGLMDLGSLFDSIQRSTRANAVNYDGTVVVGWQDFNGPWKSAVWRKNPSGGYFPNEYILIDTTANPLDEYNQMGECSSVSADGDWIGGYGDYANNYQPWIWSNDSGVINLGTFPNVGNGFVSGMSADASIVVGWFDGQLFGDPQTPFIWTVADGLQELNGYINNVLGDSTYTNQVYTADCISPDGHYISGYGVDNSSSTYFVYRVTLGNTIGIHETHADAVVKIYPNPSSGLITIDNAKNAIVTIGSMQGKIIYKAVLDKANKIDISAFTSGIYSVTVQTSDGVYCNKLIKK
jgi:hypothetical protein